jgi:hypothetical protein
MFRLFENAAIAFIACAIFLGAFPALAAPPQTINYQGYLTNAGGTPVNSAVAITFKLYDAATGGAALYTEAHPTVTVSNGNFNTLIGSVTPIPLPFNVPYWLTVSINADAEMAPRQPLSSSPYAFRAAALDGNATLAGSQISGSITTATIPVANVVGAVAGPAGPTGSQGPPGPPGPNDITGNLTMVDSTATAGLILKGSAPFLHNFGVSQTFLGIDAGNFAGTGSNNTGFGRSALNGLTTGSTNTAVGTYALSTNSSGSSNTAAGWGALQTNSTGAQNTALGQAALNVHQSGINNTAVGDSALAANISGNGNIAVGRRAGFNQLLNDNIAIGHDGDGADNATVRIGTAGIHGKTFIAGISNVTPPNGTLPVVINSAGQLGVGSVAVTGVTNIATGAGLTGGPITTAGSIGLATTQLLPTTACASGEIAKWNGSAWACGADANTVPAAACTGGSFLQWNGTSWQCTTPAISAGTVTSITAGAGLTGGTITGSGIIAIDPSSSTLTGNYFKQGGNAFGATAVIGAADNQSLGLMVKGEMAVRYEPTSGTPNVVAGATQNWALGAVGATIAGGGESNPTGPPGRNEVRASYGTVGGGWKNWVRGFYGTVAGGGGNQAEGSYSMVPGGLGNIALGANSFAAGSGAYSMFSNFAPSDGTFIWADAQYPIGFFSAAANEFAARATGGFRFVTAIDGTGNPTRTTAINPNGELDFGNNTRQMLKLWGGEAYGIGIQSDTLYQRSNSHYAWYVGGTHHDAMLEPGSNGFALMTLTNGSPAGLPAVSGVARAQTFTSTSDRAAKEAFESVDGAKVLAALVKMPLQSWKYRNEVEIRHIGPTAQDFRAAFGVGYDDKTIATVDADGVAMAAIQGLHQLMKDKDATIAGQAARITGLERELQRIKAALGLN